MNIKPRFRGFICTNADPNGCKENTKKQIDYIKNQAKLQGPKNVLVIGASKGFGLAARIVSAFGTGAATIGVFSGKPGTAKRTASAGWYNSTAFEEYAKAEGIYTKNVNGDAFSKEIKQETIRLIQQDLGKIDLIIYSLATAKRVDPDTGKTHYSVLKPVGSPYRNKTVNFHTGEVTEVEIQPATEQEIKDTVKVMGGEDWKEWICALKEADVLSDGVKTIAFSYIGPKITHPIYRNGTIGFAKEHLEATAEELNKELKEIGGEAIVTVCKGLVTQSSAAIPIVPLYISILYKVMKEKGLHEGCIEQMYRLYRDFLYAENPLPTDQKRRIRIDDWEMREDVQEEVTEIWKKVDSNNIYELTDLRGFREEFFQLFGFDLDEVEKLESK